MKSRLKNLHLNIILKTDTCNKSISKTIFKTHRPSLKTEQNLSETYSPKPFRNIQPKMCNLYEKCLWRFFPLLWSYSIMFILLLKRIQRTLILSSPYTSSEEGDRVTRDLCHHQIKLMTENQQSKHFHWPGKRQQPLPLKRWFKSWSYREPCKGNSEIFCNWLKQVI